MQSFCGTGCWRRFETIEYVLPILFSGRNGNSERRVFHALSLQLRTDQLSLFSTDRQMDFVRYLSVLVYNSVFLPLVLHPIRRFRTKIERLQ